MSECSWLCLVRYDSTHYSIYPIDSGSSDITRVYVNFKKKVYFRISTIMMWWQWHSLCNWIIKLQSKINLLISRMSINEIHNLLKLQEIHSHSFWVSLFPYIIYIAFFVLPPMQSYNNFVHVLIIHICVFVCFFYSFKNNEWP